MPTGHTTKKTLTPHRLELLRAAIERPVERRNVRYADRVQYNVLESMGLVAIGDTHITGTERGRRVSDEERQKTLA